jgi:hypothetical protein
MDRMLVSGSRPCLPMSEERKYVVSTSGANFPAQTGEDPGTQAGSLGVRGHRATIFVHSDIQHVSSDGTS